MRYQNWDVLLFPLSEDSKTPLQEFGTSCTVNQDPGKNSPVLPPSLGAADRQNNRRRSLPKRFHPTSLLHRSEGAIADCLMLHT